jgi:hypothetical protein
MSETYDFNNGNDTMDTLVMRIEDAINKDNKR